MKLYFTLITIMALYSLSNGQNELAQNKINYKLSACFGIDINDNYNSDINIKTDDSLKNTTPRKQKNYAPLRPREGNHLFSLQWIGWKNFGNADIKKINSEKYSINGEQKDTKGNFVSIDGYLYPVEKGKMKFNGEIQSKVSGNNNGEVCVKKGEFTFMCKPGRKYWRLQEMENCEGGNLVDYIDIFF